MILVDENAGITLLICKARMEQRGNRAIYGLECGEKERVIFGTQFNVVIEHDVNNIDKKEWWEEGYSLVI